jgi:hypothetical protein
MRIREKLRDRWQLVTVTVLALVLAIGVGPTVAAQLRVKSNDIVNGQVKSPDLHKSAVTNEKLNRGAVTSAKLRDGSVGQIDLGPQVIAPRAYAYVQEDGSVRSSLSRNFGAHNVVASDIPGIYCIHDLPFTFRHATVTGTALRQAGLELPSNPPCPSDTQVQVFLQNQSGAWTPGDFWITLY